MAAKDLLNRRHGLKLAFAAPAVVAGLRASVVHADSGRKGDDRRTGTRAGALKTTKTVTDTTTTDTKTDTTTTNTTTTVAGESSQVTVLGRARLCRVSGSRHLKGGGQLRLLQTADAKFLHVRIRGAGDRTLVFADSPNDVLNNTVLQLTRSRGELKLTDAIASQLLVSGSKDFADGFSLTVKVGDVTHTFVVCPDRD